MGKDFPRSTILIILIALCVGGFSSCTHITYQSDGFIPIYLNTRPDHRRDAVVEGVKEFYLWGSIHPDDKVMVDDLFYEQGYLSIGNLQVSQYQSTSQFLSAFFSLGFYIPISYRLEAKGAMAGD